VATHERAYLAGSAWPIVCAVNAAALLRQAESSGDPAPLPYLPLLNPLDLAQALAIAALMLVARSDELRATRSARGAPIGAAIASFVALNGVVVRTAHHWAGVPLTPWEVPSAPLVQAAFSILWTALALIAMVVAHRRTERGLWIAGASLLAAVVMKLFFVDLDNLSSVAKIVTFLAVGILLLLIGLLAPVPPVARAKQERA
jgi:uncharacterized membrane protein